MFLNFLSWWYVFLSACRWFLLFFCLWFPWYCDCRRFWFGSNLLLMSVERT